MSTSTPDILALARQLEASASNEAFLRSAISRSYYAALLRADEVLPHRAASGLVKGASSHEKIIERADVYSKGTNPGRSEAINVAKFLPRMKRIRVIADYYLNETVTAQACSEAIQRADFVISQCDEVERKRRQSAASL